MADAISIQELIDARTDAKTLEEAVNGDAVTTVLSRLGETYPTLSNALNQIDSKLDSADAQIKQAITDLFQNGGLPATPFATKALMTASALVDGKYAMVTDDTVNNGLYVKTAGAWVKSAYDPAALAQIYTDNKVKGVTNNFKTKALMTASTLPNDSYAMVTEDTEANNGRYSKVAGAWVKSAYDPLLKAKNYTDDVITNKGLSNLVGQSHNLFNHLLVSVGKVISSTGEVADNESYTITDYIPISYGENYVISGRTPYPYPPFNYIAFYDSDKNFLSRGQLSRASFTLGDDDLCYMGWTPVLTNVAYIRFAFIRGGGEAGESNRMFSRGEELIDYVDGIPTILAKLSDNDVQTLIADNKLRQGVSYLEPVKDWYSADASLFTGFGDWVSKSSAQVLQMWADLQAQYPHAIDKEVIGNDALGNPMYLYTVKPDTPEPASYAPPTKKIYLTCSIHGTEITPSIATYLLLREMLKRDAPKELQALRANCTLLVVPIANPSGWDLKTRKNANGVDLNRNFELGFMTGTTDPNAEIYPGEAPLSEPEAIAMDKVFKDNPDIVAFYDFHHFSSMENNFLWIPTCSPAATIKVAQPYLSRINRQWRAEFDWIPDEPNYIGKISPYQDFGMIQAQAKKYGIKYTAIFEVCRQWRVNDDIPSYGEIHCKTAVEAIANWLLINLDFLSKDV